MLLKRIKKCFKKRKQLKALKEKFPGKHTKERRREAKQANFFRRADRKGLVFYRDRRSLKSYERIFNASLVDIIKEKLKQKEKVSFLDVGAGRGRVSSQLKKQFGNKIITSSISLTRPKLANKKIEGTDLKAIDNVHIGKIESYKKLKKYDLIVSVFGIGYSKNIVKAVENACNSLNEGGMAFLQLDIISRIKIKKSSLFSDPRLKFFDAHKIGLASDIVCIKKIKE